MGFKDLWAKTAGKIKSTAAKVSEKVSEKVRGKKTLIDSDAPAEDTCFDDKVYLTDCTSIDKQADIRDDCNFEDCCADDTTAFSTHNTTTDYMDYADKQKAQTTLQDEYITVEIVPEPANKTTESNTSYKRDNNADKQTKKTAFSDVESKEIEVSAKIILPSDRHFDKPVMPESESAATIKKVVVQKQYVSLAEKIRHKIFMTRIIFSMLSMLLYTTFTIVMLQRNWGNTIYNTVILCLIGLYIILFLVMIVLSQRLSKSGKKLSRSFKDYKSGLKIMNSVLRLINFALTLSVLFTAAATRNTNTPFQTTVMIVSVVWAVFQIIFQVNMIRRRHKTIKVKK